MKQPILNQNIFIKSILLELEYTHLSSGNEHNDTGISKKKNDILYMRWTPRVVSCNLIWKYKESFSLTKVVFPSLYHKYVAIMLFWEHSVLQQLPYILWHTTWSFSIIWHPIGVYAARLLKTINQTLNVYYKVIDLWII